MSKFIKVFAVTGVFLLLPFFVSAQTSSIAELQAMIQSLMQQIANLQASSVGVGASGGTNSYTGNTENISSCMRLTSTLRMGSLGAEVSRLQDLLKNEGFSINQDEYNKQSYGESTASAVSGFQEKYKNEILTPAGLQFGTGLVGAGTRTKLNKLYPTCEQIVSMPSPENCPLKDVNGIAQHVCNKDVIKVISPNGGETLTKGTKTVINWSAPSYISKVQITLDKIFECASGNICPALYSIRVLTLEPVYNTGYYEWTVPTNLEPGKYNLNISSYDKGKALPDQNDYPFSILANSVYASSSPLMITTSSQLPNAKVGVPYNAVISGIGGEIIGDRYVYTNRFSMTSGYVSRGLVAKEVCDPCDFGISGTPLDAGTYYFTIKLTSGPQSVEKMFTLTVDSESTTPAKPSVNVSLDSSSPSTRTVNAGEQNVTLASYRATTQNANAQVSTAYFVLGHSYSSSAGLGCPIGIIASNYRLYIGNTLVGSPSMVYTPAEGCILTFSDINKTLFNGSSEILTLKMDIPSSIETGYVTPAFLSLRTYPTSTSLTNNTSSIHANRVDIQGVTIGSCSINAVVVNTVSNNNGGWGFSVKVDRTNAQSGQGWTANFQGYTPSVIAYNTQYYYGDFFLTSGPLTLNVKDSINSNCTSSVVVYPPSVSVATNLSITTESSLPRAKVGFLYEVEIDGSGDVGPYNWGFSNFNPGQVPPGLTGLGMTLGNGKPQYGIVGTPTQAGTYTFQLLLTSKNQSTGKSFTIIVDPADVVSYENQLNQVANSLEAVKNLINQLFR